MRRQKSWSLEFKTTKPWSLRRKCINIMGNMTQIVWFPCKLTTLKVKLHGFWQGHFLKIEAPIHLCKIGHELPRKSTFWSRAPLKNARCWKSWSFELKATKVTEFSIWDVKNHGALSLKLQNHGAFVVNVSISWEIWQKSFAVHVSWPH